MTKSSLKWDFTGLDPWILAPVLVLCGLGLIMVMSASSHVAEMRHGAPYHYLFRQLTALALGLVGLYLSGKLSLDFLKKLSYPILIVCLGLLALVLIPGLGIKAGGATSWLRLGPIGFQPSELAKLALVIYMAHSMSAKMTDMNRFSIGVAPHLIVGALLIGLTLIQNDMGMAGILGLLLAAMLFLGGARLSHLFYLAAAAAAMGVGLVLTAPYRLKRVIMFLDPWQDPLGGGYQIIHSFLAFGSGGLFGVGVGGGKMKLGYLPEPHTDFILSVIGEELGLVGVIIVATMFGLLAWRGFYWARRLEDPFKCYLAAGLTLMIVLQALVNMAVVLGLMPTTGLTLPLISSGGSSLLVNLIAAGLLLNLSAGARTN